MRHRKTRLGTLVSAALLGSILWPGWASSADTIERMCIFGDSLSDSGNVFEVLHEVSTRPYAAIPSAPYPMGGPTFSNGRTWIQQLAKSLGRSNDANPALRGSGPFCNYSFGTARARQRPNQPFDLPGLVAAYLEGVDDAHPDTLYVIFVGGNDVRDALVALPSNPTVSFNILNEAVSSIVQSISNLAGAGARRFLVMNAPNIGLVPVVIAQGNLAQYYAQMLSSLFNDGLANALGFLPEGIELMTFDVFSFINGVAASPPVGIVDIRHSCITPDVRVGAVCAEPDQYAFWDGIHPTKVIHAALAEAVAQELP